MRLLLEHLRHYVRFPDDVRAARELLDDIGIEVKRLDAVEAGHAVTLELLANRGDHYCYAGVAREIAGRLGGALHLPDCAELLESPGAPDIQLSSELCLVYTATLLQRTAAGGSLPDELSTILSIAGWDSGLPVVDASNLANLELGQPTHAFDADRIRGGIRVRSSVQGERCWPLFAPEPIRLPADLLVIADEEKILAVAGVIGCEDSKTTPETTRVLLESATFEPAAVRRAARALGIHTDAAARFMRGADPTLALRGAGRVATLLRPLGWNVQATTCVASWSDPARTIPLHLPRAASFIGYALTAGVVRERLERYGFSLAPGAADTLAVRVPPARLWDVRDEADLCEELCRSFGYNALGVDWPFPGRGSSPSALELAKSKVDELLIGCGFFEIFSDAFYAKSDRTSLGIDEGHTLWPHIEVLNAIDRDYALLKNNALIHALHSAAANLRVGYQEIKAYEWTRTFHPDAEGCRERALLWGVVSGHDRPPSWADKPRAADVYYLTGLVEELRLLLRVPLHVRPAERHVLREFLHPRRACDIWLGERCVGALGEIHPEVLLAFRIKHARPCYFELDADVLREPERPRSFEPPPARSASLRNLSLEVPAGISSGELIGAMRGAGPAWLERIDVCDYFEQQPLRVLTFELAFELESAARSGEEVNAACEAIVSAVESQWAARGVQLRR